MFNNSIYLLVSKNITRGIEFYKYFHGGAKWQSSVFS